MASSTEYAYKLVLLGESAVGKTSLAVRFAKGQFSEFQESTIGAAFLTHTIQVDSDSVKFEIWDTAGQERYHSLAPMYYRGAKAAIVVFDLTKADSFQRAKTWVTELQQSASMNIVIALAGNKCDLESQRAITKEEAQAYADENELIYVETSAKAAINVNEAFVQIAEILPRGGAPNPGTDPLRVTSDKSAGGGSGGGGCCGGGGGGTKKRSEAGASI